jgi:hypothetical protein
MACSIRVGDPRQRQRAVRGSFSTNLGGSRRIQEISELSLKSSALSFCSLEGERKKEKPKQNREKPLFGDLAWQPAAIAAGAVLC